MVHFPPGFTQYKAWCRPQMPMMYPRTQVTYNYSPCDHNSGGMTSAGWWTLGIAALLGATPGILEACGVGGGGGGSKKADGNDGAANGQPTAEQQSTLTNLKSIYDGYNWIFQDGQFMAYDKTTQKCVASGTTFTQIQATMNELANKKPEGNTAGNLGDLDANQIAGLSAEATKKGCSLEFDRTKGEWVIKDADGNVKQFTDEAGQPIKLTTEAQIRAALATIEKKEAPAEDDPVKKFNENSNVTAKNASIAKNGDKYTLTITNADGSKTVYEDLESIEAAYTKLGLNADGTPVKPKSTYIKAKLPDGYEWLEAKKGRFKKGTSVDDILDELHKDEKLKNITKQDLLNANPIAIKNGVVSGEGKLEIPTKKIVISNQNGRTNSYTRNEGTPRESIVTYEEGPDGRYIVRETFTKLDTAFMYRCAVPPIEFRSDLLLPKQGDT